VNLNRCFLILFFLLLCQDFTARVELHDFHMSKSEIRYVSENNTIELSIHIFIDDLELTLKDLEVEGLHIGTDKEVPEADEFIAKYLESTVVLSCDQKELQAKWIGKELSEDLMAIWCYMQIEGANDCQEITIMNTILTEKYDDQKNIVSFKTDTSIRDYFIFDSEDQIRDFDCQ